MGFSGNPVPPSTGTGAAVSRNSQRLRAEARAVRLNGLNICQSTALTIAKAKEFFSALELSPMHH